MVKVVKVGDPWDVPWEDTIDVSSDGSDQLGLAVCAAMADHEADIQAGTHRLVVQFVDQSVNVG